jgi:hypothetical protein
MRNDDKALKHVVGLLNACGASWFDPEHYAPAATGEYGSGYQPETFAAQEFLREQGGGWADGAGWLTPTQMRELPVCKHCGERFKPPAGGCMNSAEDHEAADGGQVTLTTVREAVALALVIVDEHYPLPGKFPQDHDPPEAVWRSLADRGLVRIDQWVEGRDAIESALWTHEGAEYLERLVKGELP